MLKLVREAGQGILTAGLSFMPPVMCTDLLALAANVKSRDDQAGCCAALVSQARDVPPGISRIGTVDTEGVAVRPRGR